MKKKLVILGVIVFLVFMSFAYAIYRTTSTGNASIVAASYSVSATSSDTSVGVISGQTTDTYSLTVRNDSEVDVVYKIIISNLPNGMQAKLDNGSFVQATNNQIVFTGSNLELLYSGTKTKTHTITFQAVLDTEEVTNRQVKIDVEFKQKLN